MSEALSESKFETLADDTLSRMVEALADLEDDDLDVDLESGVLTLRFHDGSRFIVNSHRAARQIWMAAGSTAWHFDWDGRAWVAQKSGDELWATVTRWTSEKLGRPVDLPKA
ncbi:MAG: iron donor protein CyaY [Myxococcota bacterium]